MLKLLDKLMVRLNRKRLVYDRIDGELYLTRYYLFLKERTKCPFNIFLHRFHKSDDEVFHDHPWSYATLILKGGYWEHTPVFNTEGKQIAETCAWRMPGHFRFSPAHSFHRIELDPEVDCWTLFCPGPQKRDWGFMVRGQWIQWQQYLNSRKASA